MHTNDFIVNDGTARQAIKGVAELFPHLDRESTATLIIKAVNPIDPCTLMISAEQEKVLRVLYFVSKQQTYNFERLLPAINIVSQKQVVRLAKMKKVTK